MQQNELERWNNGTDRLIKAYRAFPCKMATMILFMGIYITCRLSINPHKSFHFYISLHLFSYFALLNRLITTHKLLSMRNANNSHLSGLVTC